MKKYLLLFALILSCTKQTTQLHSGSVSNGTSHPYATIDSVCYNPSGKVYHVRCAFHRLIDADSQVISYKTGGIVVDDTSYKVMFKTKSNLHTHRYSDTGFIVVDIWRNRSHLFSDSVKVFGIPCNNLK